MNPPFGDDPVCIHCGSKKRDGLRVAELQRQRDELLEALKETTKRCAMDFCNYKPEFMPPESAFYLPLVEAANKAIASVKGGAA